MQDFFKQLKEFGKVRVNEPMHKHTTFQIGGQARFFVLVDDNKKLIELLNFLNGEGVDYIVFGGGSNLLFQDNEYDGVVIKLATHDLQLVNNTIQAEAGVMLGQTLQLAMQNGLSGLEWAAGVPGTIGGAVRGNAGAFGQDISSNIDKVEIWEDGEQKILNKSDCDFVYRGSFFKNKKNVVILRVWLKLEFGDKSEILKKVHENLQARKGKFPIYPSAGCFFTNVKLDKWTGEKKDLPPLFLERGTVPAGWLVEQVEAKGLTVGGAKVSEEHGNFVVNFNKADAEDVKKLVEDVRQRVYNKFGIELEFEVEII